MPYTAKQISDLQDERTNDPLTRSYSGMTNSQFLSSITAIDRLDARTSMSAGEIFESVDSVEFDALTAALKVRVDRVLGLGAEIVVGPGNNHQAVQELITAFGGGSATIASLSALRDQLQTRAKEIGLPDPILADVARTT